MARTLNRRQFAVTLSCAGIVAATGAVQAKQAKDGKIKLRARIEDMQVRKGSDGNPYTIVICQALQNMEGLANGRSIARGDRLSIVKKGDPHQLAKVGMDVVISLDEAILEKIIGPGAMVPPEADPMPYCCIPIIILIPGDAPPPKPDPDEGGEGTDPDKDEDEDEDPDRDTDGFVSW